MSAGWACACSCTTASADPGAGAAGGASGTGGTAGAGGAGTGGGGGAGPYWLPGIKQYNLSTKVILFMNLTSLIEAIVNSKRNCR